MEIYLLLHSNSIVSFYKHFSYIILLPVILINNNSGCGTKNTCGQETGNEYIINHMDLVVRARVCTQTCMHA